MKRFSPIVVYKKYLIKARISKTPEYELKFGTWRQEKDIINKIFSQLHYLGSHSYRAEKWKKAERRLFNAHPNKF